MANKRLSFPANVARLSQAQPVYETLPGWDEDMTERKGLSRSANQCPGVYCPNPRATCRADHDYRYRASTTPNNIQIRAQFVVHRSLFVDELLTMNNELQMNGFAEKQTRTAERLGLSVEQIPRHIAIIMDGNGRWAQRNALPRVEGHRQGAKTAERIARCCAEFGIQSLTLYSFSMENWKRPQAEVDALMHLYSRYLIQIRPKLMANNVKLIHLGRIAGLPDAVETELAETVQLTANNTGMVLALALNYGGRAGNRRRNTEDRTRI